MKTRHWITWAVSVVASAPMALAQFPGIIPVGTSDPNATTSRLQALTPDGKYAAGFMAVSGLTYPIVHDVQNNVTTLLPRQTAGLSDATVTEARGIIIRQDISGPIIGISGVRTTGGTSPVQWYEAPLSDMTTGVWNNSSQSGMQSGAFNVARLAGNGTQWYIAGANSGSTQASRQRVNTASVAGWQGGSGSAMFTHSVSQNSIGIGWDSGNAGNLRRASYWTAVNNNAGRRVVPGGGLLRSEGFGISNNANAPSAGDLSVGVVSGNDYTDTVNGNYQAFLWGAGDAGMTLLGRYGTDLRSVAYGVNGNKIAVGMSHPGGANPNARTDYTGELGVIWDTTGLWDSTGQAKLIMDILIAKGVDMSAWTRLIRAVSVSDDGKTISGWGTWAADGSTRAFIATVPEPATISLLALGGLLSLRRRKA